MDYIKFRCLACAAVFSGEPARIEPDPDRPWHPFEYFKGCPTCHSESPQDPQERGLIKAHAHATGPRTLEGKAKSAANLDGHPTPEEALRTRFNAMTHGMAARVADKFPAKPGKYPHCKNCSYLDVECVEDPQPGHVNPISCLKRTELFMRHDIAFEQGDPKILMSIRSDHQAALAAIMDDMILAIIADGGPRTVTPVWYHDKDGVFHLAQFTDQKTGQLVQLDEIKEHPLLKRLMDFTARNSLTLADMGMTPRVIEEHDIVRGHLEQQGQDQSSLLEYQQKQTVLLEQLTAQIQRSQNNTKRDTVLIEYARTAGENG